MLKNLRTLLAPVLGTGHGTNRPRPAGLRVESLEDRHVPSAVITDYTQIAQMFPRHSGTSNLLLNFDGWKDEGISPFQTTTGNRDRDIQDILYRVSETFAPFDVRVLREFGDGAYATDHGDTTIFVGDATQNGDGVRNIVKGWTPPEYSDYPNLAVGVDHHPNNDTYDLAYVDPVGFRGSAGGVIPILNNYEIAKAVSHEAGHTFGLGHVLTDVPGGAVNDVMSYTVTAENQFFADQTFPLTNLNGYGTTDELVPHWYTLAVDPHGASYVPYKLQTQDSYAILSALLGNRPADDYASVAHSFNVQYFTPPVTLPSATTLYGKLERGGDSDAFTYTASLSGQVNVRLISPPLGISGYTPEVLVYDSAGVRAYSADATSTLSFTLTKGEKVSIVVGGHGGWIGDYQLLFSAPHLTTGGLQPPSGGVVAPVSQTSPFGAPSGTLVALAPMPTSTVGTVDPLTSASFTSGAR